MLHSTFCFREELRRENQEGERRRSGRGEKKIRSTSKEKVAREGVQKSGRVRYSDEQTDQTPKDGGKADL